MDDPSEAESIAELISQKYFQDSSYHFTVGESIPTNLPEDLRTKVEGQLAASSDSKYVLTVYPEKASEVNAT